jgi:hypothetical protein
MVMDHESEHPSRWAAATSIARKIGCCECFYKRLSVRVGATATFGPVRVRGWRGHTWRQSLRRMTTKECAKLKRQSAHQTEARQRILQHVEQEKLPLAEHGASLHANPRRDEDGNLDIGRRVDRKHRSVVDGTVGHSVSDPPGRNVVSQPRATAGIAKLPNLIEQPPNLLYSHSPSFRQVGVIRAWTRCCRRHLLTLGQGMEPDPSVDTLSAQPSFLNDGRGRAPATVKCLHMRELLKSCVAPIVRCGTVLFKHSLDVWRCHCRSEGERDGRSSDAPIVRANCRLGGNGQRPAGLSAHPDERFPQKAQIGRGKQPPPQGADGAMPRH